MAGEPCGVSTKKALRFIAWYTSKSYQLTLKIQELEDARSRREEVFQLQLRDLYEAIVVATIVSDPSRDGNYISTINAFKAPYKGNTKIFTDTS